MRAVAIPSPLVLPRNWWKKWSWEGGFVINLGRRTS